MEGKGRGLVTVCDKSVLLHEDFVLSSFPRTTSSSIIRSPAVRPGLVMREETGLPVL